MKDKFYKQLDNYLNDKLSANDFILNFKLLDRKRFINNSNHLLNDIDIRFKKLFDELKPNIEELTELRYAGCYNSLKNTNADFKSYVLKFQYYNNIVNIRLGSFASSGSGDNIKYIKYNDRNNELNFWYNTPSCNYSGGELNIDNENILLDSLTKVINFYYYDDKQRQIFLDNFKKISNKELYSKLNEY